MGEEYLEKTAQEIYQKGFNFEKRARTLKDSDNEKGQLLIQASAMYQGAAQLLEKQEKYGPSEKFWKKSKALYQEVMGHEDYFNQKQINQVNRKRLIKIGKYLQRREDRKKSGGLENLSATIAIIGLIGGLFFLSSNFTGNVIGLNQSIGNILAAVLLIVGLVAGFFWVRSRKKK